MRELRPREVKEFAQGHTQLVDGGARIEFKTSARDPHAINPPSQFMSFQPHTFEFLAPWA